MLFLMSISIKRKKLNYLDLRPDIAKESLIFFHRTSDIKLSAGKES